MLDYQRVTALIESRQCASRPLVGALAFLLLMGLVSGCTGGKSSRDDSATPPPPEPVEQEAPAPAAESEMSDETDELPAPQPVLNPSAPQKYVVKRGDTLWDIAATFLRDPWYWPEIWYVNPQIENPHLIYPGDELSLGVGANGQPIVSVVRGANARLSPRMHSEQLDSAIKAIPYEVVAAFMSKPSVLAKDQIPDMPYVLAGRDGHVVMGAGSEIYVMNLDGEKNSRYNIVHVGDELVDPEDGKVVGYQGIYTGSGRVDRPGSPAKMVLTESARETREGDRLISDSLDVQLDFVPHAPSSEVNGVIISVIDGVTNIGAFQVVVINRGARDGLEAGHVLGVSQKGETVRDRNANSMAKMTNGLLAKRVRLPNERAGIFMVFKTYDRISFGLIMSADHQLHIGDLVGNP